MENRKRGFGRTLALVVGLALIVTFVAGTGMAFAADPATRPAANGAAPPDVVAKANVAWDQHVQFLQLRHECGLLMDQIRHKVQELRAAGVVIPDETRQAIKNSKDAIRASQETIRGTIAQMKAERTALHEDRQAKNWAGVLGHLETIIGIQVTRLQEAGHIPAQLQNILQLLDSVG